MPYQRAQPINKQNTTIRADLYPAKVTWTDGRVQDPVKVLIGLDKIWLYTVTGNTGEHISTHPIDNITGTLQHGYTITSNNDTIRVERSKNCGCGNNKSWKPFPYKIAMTPIPR